MNKIKEVTLSKTVKLPIEGVQFSNKQVSVTITYEANNFDVSKATDELNQMLTIVKEQDPEWLRDRNLFDEKYRKGGENEQKKQ